MCFFSLFERNIPGDCVYVELEQKGETGRHTEILDSVGCWGMSQMAGEMGIMGRGWWNGRK